MENDTVKRRELAWKNVTSKIQDVLFPLMQATNAEQKLLLEVPSPSQTASVQEEHQAERKANNIMEIETLPNSNHLGAGHILNHAIKAYAQCHSAEKKIAKYIGPNL